MAAFRPVARFPWVRFPWARFPWPVSGAGAGAPMPSLKPGLKPGLMPKPGAALHGARSRPAGSRRALLSKK